MHLLLVQPSMAQVKIRTLNAMPTLFPPSVARLARFDFKSVTVADLDGTLFDTVADLHEACQRMLAELKPRPFQSRKFNLDRKRDGGFGRALLNVRCSACADQLAAGIASFQRHYATAVNGDFCGNWIQACLEGLQAWKK